MNKKIDIFKSEINNYTGEQFEEYFETLCSEFQNNLDILTFGIIIYDETNPVIRKILRDSDYWSALDKASGEKMIIFSIKDSVVPLPVAIKQSEKPFMVSFPQTDKDLTNSYSMLIKKIFGSKIPISYPSVLFFQIMNSNILDYLLVPLVQRNVWNSANSIQELFISVSDILNNIIEECYENRAEIFQLVKNELKRQKINSFILKGPKRVSDIISIFRNLSFL